jgi:uncharacterized membrane protein
MNMVERNGLEHRGREQKFAFWSSIVIGFFFISFFIAPFTIEKGATGHLSGNANLFDYVSEEEDSWGSGGNKKVGPHEHDDGEIVEHSSFAWSELNIFAAFIYGFGDLNCHQKHERSWMLNENQMPVCTRDIGIFFGLFLGSVAFYFRGVNRWTVRDTCLSLYSDRWLNSIYVRNQRTLAWLLSGVILCLPLIFDGFYQLLTSYESNNAVRIMTGVPFGFGLGILFLGMYSARSQFFSNAAAVRLPGGVSFTLVKAEESE